MQHRVKVIAGQGTLVKGPATDQTQYEYEEESIMIAQLKPVSIIGTIGQGTSKRFAHYTLIGATLAVLLLATIAVGQSVSHRSSGAISPTRMTTQQRRFLDVNDTWLPTSVMPDATPVVVPSERARFLDVNTNLGMVADASPVAPSVNRQRFIEVNTNLGMVEALTVPAYPYGEAVTPVRGPR
ncbi:MAG: hypothetical protein ACYDAR_12630 [Thermomicrobiales bacterium]